MGCLKGSRHINHRWVPYDWRIYKRPYNRMCNHKGKNNQSKLKNHCIVCNTWKYGGNRKLVGCNCCRTWLQTSAIEQGCVGCWNVQYKKQEWCGCKSYWKGNIRWCTGIELCINQKIYRKPCQLCCRKIEKENYCRTKETLQGSGW